MNSELVVRRNEVINASYRLSVIEQRVLLTAISKIPKQTVISDDEIYSVSVEDLKNLGMNEKTVYRDLKEAVNRLYERSINLISGMGDNETGLKMRWVQEIHYTAETSSVSLRFSKSILPYISNVKNNFTQYALSEVAQMQSAYSIRIYELCRQYLTIGNRKITIDELRGLLDLGSKYKTTGNFMAWVIEPSVDEINKLTNLSVKAEPKRTGRKYTHIEFTIKGKSKDKNKGKCDKTIDWVDNQSEITRPLTQSQAIKFAGTITSYCYQNNMTGAVHTLGGKLTRTYNSWYEAKDDICAELQDEKQYKKYIEVLKLVKYREL